MGLRDNNPKGTREHIDLSRGHPCLRPWPAGYQGHLVECPAFDQRRAGRKWRLIKYCRCRLGVIARAPPFSRKQSNTTFANRNHTGHPNRVPASPRAYSYQSIAIRSGPIRSAPLRDNNVRCLSRRWCRAIPKCNSNLRMGGTLRYPREGKTPRAKLTDTPPSYQPVSRSDTGWSGYDTGRSLSVCDATAFLPDRNVRCAVMFRTRLCVHGWWVGLVLSFAPIAIVVCLAIVGTNVLALTHGR